MSQSNRFTCLALGYLASCRDRCHSVSPADPTRPRHLRKHRRSASLARAWGGDVGRQPAAMSAQGQTGWAHEEARGSRFAGQLTKDCRGNEPRVGKLAFATLQPAFNPGQALSAVQVTDHHPTNHARRVRPLVRHSDPVRLFFRARSVRGSNFSIWLNTLQDAFTPGLLGAGWCAWSCNNAPILWIDRRQIPSWTGVV